MRDTYALVNATKTVSPIYELSMWALVSTE